MKYKVSVVVPVYLAEAYLKRCIDSLLAQTMKEIQIVLVEDGSPDKSGAICDEYKEKYAQILVIHQENTGLTGAWKRGVLEASGQYIGFVDSDDYVAQDMYEKMYQMAIEKQADMVCCGIQHVFENKAVHKDWNEQTEFENEVYSQTEIQEQLYSTLINDGRFMGRRLMPNRVSKLIKREIIVENMDKCDNDVTIGEDYQFTCSILFSLQKMCIMKDYFPYFYWINEGSMTGDYDEAYMNKIHLLKEKLESLCEEADCKWHASGKTGRSLTEQIQNDFLCLSILHLKSSIVKMGKRGYLENRKNIKAICLDREVKKALRGHTMDQLTFAERLFLMFMRHHFYFLQYLCVKLYFSL